MQDITSTIGNTPLVKLKRIVPEACADIYVKLEYFNPTGSYKDRMALAIIEEAEKRGALQPGMKVVECTGGSTGTSLALVCTIKGYRFLAVSSDAYAKEKLQSIRLFGGELELIPSAGGKITPDLIPQMIKRAEEIGATEGAYLTRQFVNEDALQGHRKMGREILEQVKTSIDVFCAAVGTAGMAAGVSAALKAIHPDLKTILLEPESAPLISRGLKGTHGVEGIGVGFVPPLLEKIDYDEVRAIPETEARTMAKRLAAEEGIFAGVSTGLNVTAALRIAQELGPGHTVVTVACDSGMKYLSSGLFA
jgi:cysteine synthase A